MKTLELKHLAPYLPYGLKIMVDRDKANIAYLSTKRIAFCLVGGYGEVEKIQWKYAHKSIKPILRPLSDLDLPEDNEFNTPENLQGCTFGYVTGLISEHYDVFGLIEKGLAIDINTI